MWAWEILHSIGISCNIHSDPWKMNSGWQEQTSCCSTGNRLTRGWDGAPDWEKMKSNGSRSTGRVKSPCGSDGLRQSRAWIFLVWHCQIGGSESTDREEERSGRRVAEGQQGTPTRGENVLGRKVTLVELWKAERHQIEIPVQEVYDMH